MEPGRSSPGKTWVFLSDLCQMERLDSLAALLCQGPAAGVTVCAQSGGRGTPSETLWFRGDGYSRTVRQLRLLKNHQSHHGALGIPTDRRLNKYNASTRPKARSPAKPAAASPSRPPNDRWCLPRRSSNCLYPKQVADRSAISRTSNAESTGEKSTSNGSLRTSGFVSPMPRNPPRSPCPNEHLQFPQDTTAILAELGFSPARTSSRPRRKPRLAEPSGHCGDRKYSQQAAKHQGFRPGRLPQTGDIP